MDVVLRILNGMSKLTRTCQSQIECRNRRLGVTIGKMLIVTLLFAHPLMSQSYSTSTGSPSFSTPQQVETGFVDASEGNLHLSIPLGSYRQRGSSHPENITLEYDSNFWQPLSLGSYNVWVPNGPNAGNGWYTSFPWVFSPIAIQSSNCQTDIPWSDQNGTVHYFHVTTGAAIFTNSTDCGGESDAFATDSSGYHMYVWNRSASSQSGDNGSEGFAVYAPDGTIADSDCYGTCPAGIGIDSSYKGPFGKDTNGNYLYGLYGDTLTDTLGRQVTGGDYAGNGSPGAPAITVPNSQGTAQYQLKWATINVKTNFGQANVVEVQQGYPSPQLVVLQSVQLPDSAGSYTFTYDCDQSDPANPTGVCSSPGGHPGYYGVITGIRLPTGGSATYSYNVFGDAGNSKGLWVTSYSGASGNWSYSGPQVLSTCTASQPVNCQQKAVVTSPTGTTEYTYQLNNGAWPITVVQKDPSGTVLSTIANTFDFTQPCVTIKCQGNAFITLTKQVSTIPTAGGGSLKKQTAYTYDSPQYGNQTAVQEWAFIPAANNFSSLPDRATYMSYLNYNSVPAYTTANVATISGGSNINRPMKITHCNNSGSDPDCPGGGSKVAQTKYVYDVYGSGGLTLVSGVMQHDDNSFGASFTARGNPTSIARWVSGSTYLTTSYTYDTTGQILSMTDPANNITRYSYADNFFVDQGNGTSAASYTSAQTTNALLTSVTDAIGTYTEGYYYGSGAAAITTDYNHQSVYSHYQDGLNRKTEEIDPIGWKLATYTSATQSDTYTPVADASPSTACVSCQHTQVSLDSWGRTASEILINNPIGPIEVDSSYDLAGRLYSQSHPYSGSGDPNHVSEITGYDSYSRQISTTHPDGQSQQAAYGPSVSNLGGLTAQKGPTSYGYGYPQISQDESGNQRQQWTDGFGQVIEVDEPSSSAGLSTSPYVTSYAYDAAGRLTQVVQGGQTRAFGYDGLGRKTSDTTPEGGTVTLTYTTATGVPCSGDPSSVCTRTDARGVTSTYTYDHANRLMGVTYTVPSGQNIASMPNICTTSNGVAANICYRYDQGGAAAYAIGKPTTMIDSTGSESYTYDADGRTTQLTKVINGQTFNVGYRYNVAGALTEIIYPSGRMVQHAYNQVGQLCQIATAAADCTPAGSYYASNFSYNSSGKLTGVNYGNGLTGAFYYSPDRNQLTYLAYRKGASTYFNLQYAYQQSSAYAPSCPHATAGNNGSIQCIMDNVDAGRSVGYGYDQLQRLLTAKTCGSTNFAQWGVAETYDRFGNRWGQTATAGQAYQPSLMFGLNGIDSSTKNQPIGFTFDGSGNMTVDNAQATMTYDGESRMTSYNGIGSYSYDGNGLRVVKSANGTSTVSIFSGGSVIAEYDNGVTSSTPSREYIYDPAGGPTTGLLAMISGGSTAYYHQDSLSVRLVTDDSGNVLSQQGTYPFGESWYQSGSSNKWIFTSYDRDSESGLDYAMARYYDSRTGAFTTPDLVYGSSGDPQSWNRYMYGKDNPIEFTDPSGQHWWNWVITFAAIGADIFTAGFGTTIAAGATAALEGIGENLAIGYGVNATQGHYGFSLGDLEGAALGGALQTAENLIPMPTSFLAKAPIHFAERSFNSFLSNEAVSGKASVDWIGAAIGTGMDLLTDYADQQATNCQQHILDAANAQSGQNYTDANVTDHFSSSTFAPQNTGTLNVNISGSTTGISPGLYPVNWWTYVVGYGPTLHVVDSPGGLHSGKTLVFGSNQATFHIDSAYVYNPIGTFFHWKLNMTGAGGYPAC